ncbi:ABC transporter substrate-binding protein [bacterium]|nr:ABC transporter substrate-binding protein [bacterium]
MLLRKLGAVLALAALSFAAVVETRPLPASAAEDTTTFVFGRGSDSIILDPPKAEDGESVAVIDNVFDGLVRYADDSTEIEPCLAEKWEHSPDGKTWTFHLAKDVKFHDGSPCDAQAVVFTFERLTQEKHPLHSPDLVNTNLYSSIKKVTAKDALTVEFQLEPAVPPTLFLSNLTVYTARILCPGALQANPKEYGEKPIGTGPFVFKKLERKQKIILEANKNYFRGAPRLSRLIFVPIEENEARLKQLLAGKLDAMDGVSPTAAKEIGERKDFALLRQTGMNVGYLAFNCEKKPWSDARVRRAAALALDPARIVSLNLQGMGTVAKNLMPPFIFAWDKDAPDPAPRRDEAKKLLEQAGVSLPLKLELLHMANPRPYFPEPKQTALVIQDDLKKVGIEATLAVMDWKQYIPKTRAGEFEACLLGWTGDTADPDNFLYILAGKDNVNGTNVSRYADESVNKACVAGQSELDDAKRRALYVDVQRKLREDAPLVPLVHADQLVGARSRVKGLKLHPTGRREFRLVSLND